MEKLKKLYDEIDNLEDHLNKNVEINDKLLINKVAFAYEVIASLETDSILWSDLPIDFKNGICFPYVDVGIDLMKTDYSYIGQVKHYKENSYIPSEGINRFVLCYYHLIYHGIKIPTVELVTPPNVKMRKPKLDYKFLTHHIIDKDIIHKWIKKVKNFTPPVSSDKFKLRKCQRDAKKIILNNWGENLRIKMCCGSGKTDTICSIISKKKESRFLILVPLIILMSQWKEALKEWGIESSIYDKNLNDRVVLCVYNSFEKVKNETWDYLIVDEAHHFEYKKNGENEESESENDEENEESESEESENDEENEESESEESESEKKTYYDLIRKGMKRFNTIELSATLTGEVDYEYNLRQGINDGILCDYQIRVPHFTSRSDDGIVKYLIDKPEFLSILAFCNRIDSANKFNDKLIEYGFNSVVLTSETSKKERNRIIEGFKNGEIKIIVSVNILGEGVNLVNADTCLFVEPRSSCYSIIQCVGRVLRISPEKKIAKIIIPDYNDNGELRKFMKAFSISDEIIHKEIKNKERSHRLVVDICEDDMNGEYLYENILDSNFNYLLNGDWNYKCNLLKEFYIKNERLPKQTDEYQNVNIGKWLNRQKMVYKKGNLSEERINLLNDITEEWSEIKIADWKATCNLLKEFYIKNDRLPKWTDEYQNVNIGDWLGKQKTAYKKGTLSEERINLLNDITEEWNKDQNSVWNATCNLMKEFYIKNDRLPKCREEYQNVNIGKWLNWQKQAYKNGTLSEERINLLNDITEEWSEIKDINSVWNATCNLLKEFYIKNDRLPKSTDEYQNVNIGKWLSTQKTAYKKGNLSEERINLLNDITEEWNKDQNSVWNATCNLMKEFYIKNERLPKRTDEYQNVNIGKWLNWQKTAYKKGTLSEERINLLNDITEEWNKDQNSVWNATCNLLKEFYIENDRLPKRTDEYQNVNIGSWLDKQKMAYKKGNLSEERINLLNDITEEWSEIKKVKLDWNATCNLMKEFYIKNDRLPKRTDEYQNVNIGSWLNTQKTAYKNGTLSSERINLLNDITKIF